MYTTLDQINKLYQDQCGFKAIVRQSSSKERINLLKSLRDNICMHEPKIKMALHSDFNKNKIESDITEIFPVLIELDHVIRNLKKWMKTEQVARSLFFPTVQGKIQREPKGNTLIITPWNYPFQLPFVHLISSVAAGNTVMLKLSENTPHTNQVVKKIIEMTFEQKHVAVIEGEIKETTYLLGLKFDHVHFTGSPAVGRIIMRAAAQHLTDITLELGGKSPVFIDKNIDIKKVVQNIIWAKFLNAGQTCIAPDYLLVDVSMKDQIETSFKEELIKAFGRDAQQSANFARIINMRQFDRLLAALAESNQTIIFGGNSDRNDRYIEPSILSNPLFNSQIMNEEIFGPILPIIYYKNLHEAFELVASKEKPLALYIFSKNRKYINTVLANTTAGGTTINDALVHILHPNLPFGGVNNSGIGQSLGLFGFKNFSHERGIADVKLFPMTKFFWYPYTKKTDTFLQWIKKCL